MADISWVTAEIGGGKSLFAVRTNCKELRRTERAIVNNLPWEKEKLIDWCHNKIDKPVDLQKRLRVLSAQEVIEFYRYFPPVHGDIESVLRGRAAVMLAANPSKRSEVESWFTLAMKHQSCFAEGKLPMEVITGHERPMLQLRQGDGGIFYTLDEVHLSFPARFWQEHGLAVEHYMSQLRKLNDDLMLITQHADKVDKNFRRNGTEWIVLQNMSKSKLFAGVTLDGRFRAHLFPSQPSRGDKPTESPWFHLNDDGYETLYSTMAGVGLIGHIKPEQTRRKKGRHWWVWVLILIMAVVFASCFPTVMTRLAKWALSHFLGSVGDAAVHQVDKNRPLKPVTTSHALSQADDFQRSPEVTPDNRSQPSLPDSLTVLSTPAVRVECTGYVYQGGRAQVWLTDGRVAYSEDGDVQWLRPHTVRVFNHVYPVQEGVSVSSVVQEAYPMPIEGNYPYPSYSTPVPSSDVPQSTVSVYRIGNRSIQPQTVNGFQQSPNMMSLGTTQKNLTHP